MVIPAYRIRRRRVDAHGDIRYLTFSCFQRRPFLLSQTACGWLADSMVRAGEKHDVGVLGYVFMPEHVHLLVVPHSETPAIGDYLRSLKQSVTQRAMLARQRSNLPPKSWEPYLDIGPNGEVAFRFWQRGGGYDRNLFTVADVTEKLDYIHRNPTTRGLVQSATDWQWSSARFYQGLEMGPVLLEKPDW